MEGVVVNFRRGRHRVNHYQMIIVVDGVDNKEKAAELVGKKVTWTSPAGKELVGEVTAPHGGKGAVRARFEPGLPGQSLGQKVAIA
ncbi:MAG: 50S ribosomal protein L35ae [Nanoarchaeota archaeon]|nr:50S ribosomal protein L35ae [Nanoarchaeota archaeon]|tara:strand:+ start:3799 stop:4056 length:258 start_codon:yes stop_codon:yes gene_type:complete